MTGSAVAELQPIDAAIADFMSRYQVPGGAFGLVKDGRLVFARGYGFADVAHQERVYPDSRFRLASLSKSITAASVLRLVDDGKLGLDDLAFNRLGYPAPTYPGARLDPRINAITVQQLLHHTGGWNRTTAIAPDGTTYFDPTVSWTVQAAEDMKVPAPASPEILVRWMLGKPVQFDPGTQYQYSNFGYTVLGRLIERVTGMSYEHYTQSWLAKAGITRMRIGGSRLVERAAGEVVSYDAPNAALVPPVFPQDTTNVPAPYAFSYPAMDAHGGWIASPIDLLRFVTVVDRQPTPPDLISSTAVSNMTSRVSPPWSRTEEPFYGMGWEVRNTSDNWWHTGGLPGVATEMVRAGNGFTWVLLFNYRESRNESQFYNNLDQLGWKAIRGVSKWPTNDLFANTLSYPAWQALHFPAAKTTSAEPSADSADPDGDGLPNLVEFASGLDPHIPDRGNRPVAKMVKIDGQAYLTVSFRRLLIEHEVSYVVEGSDDGVHWSFGSAGPFDTTLNPDGTLLATYRDPLPIIGKKRFLRVRIARRTP